MWINTPNCLRLSNLVWNVFLTCDVSLIHFLYYEGESFSAANPGSLEFGYTVNNFTELSKKGVQIVFSSLTLENTSYAVGVKESVQ